MTYPEPLALDIAADIDHLVGVKAIEAEIREQMARFHAAVNEGVEAEILEYFRDKGYTITAPDGTPAEPEGAAL